MRNSDVGIVGSGGHVDVVGLSTKPLLVEKLVHRLIGGRTLDVNAYHVGRGGTIPPAETILRCGGELKAVKECASHSLTANIMKI